MWEEIKSEIKHQCFNGMLLWILWGEEGGGGLMVLYKISGWWKLFAAEEERDRMFMNLEYYVIGKQTSHVIRASQNYTSRLLLLGEHARRLSKKFPKPGLNTSTYDNVVEILDISAPKY